MALGETRLKDEESHLKCSTHRPMGAQPWFVCCDGDG
jgi:hypothetical protein